LDVDFGTLISANREKPNAQAKLVANLPYNISTAILQKLADYRSAFSEMVLMLQREVVERITAQPGNSERGYLTVLIEAYFDVEKLFDVPPTAFRPQPKVWSSVIRLTPKVVTIADDATFRDLISRAFGQKRKTILNNLKRDYADAGSLLTRAGIDTKRRSETLSIEEWAKLTSLLSGK
jgi:16S rRNA (adenine1518-N6/adenine1519-N6)-dimethyltransferase